nr:immunoglobulin heavy chain junction region [Macaca mulatta]MOV39644.1 immunoglobulin heavy chain junction region [Macaca mulatta]MOV40121.1 immunoglobulin heavy chain junction region [Macaca mulatta]
CARAPSAYSFGYDYW